jgi:hypothetical protein
MCVTCVTGQISKVPFTKCSAPQCAAESSQVDFCPVFNVTEAALRNHRDILSLPDAIQGELDTILPAEFDCSSCMARRSRDVLSSRLLALPSALVVTIPPSAEASANFLSPTARRVSCGSCSCECLQFVFCPP